MRVMNYSRKELWKGFKDPTPVGEDPDASQEEFKARDTMPNPEPYNPYDVYDIDIKTEAIAALFHGLEQQTRSLGIVRSYKHISLPEALIYCYIFDNPEKTIGSAELSVINSRLGTGVLELKLNLRGLDQTLLTSYDLLYYYAGLSVSIKENNQIVGEIRYVIRGQKCEEISGTLHGSPLVLDPVWHPTKAGELRQESFHYKHQKTTLIYQANRKFTCLGSAPTKQFSMEHKTIKKFKNRTVVIKAVRCNNHQFNVTLHFHKNILIPIFGQWIGI